MARPQLPMGEWGNIAVRKLPNGKSLASARYRGWDGVTRQVKATGTSDEAARRKLQAELKDRSQDFSVDIDRETRLDQLGQAWLTEAKQSRLTRQSLQEYENILLRTIEPAIGQWRIREASVGRLDKFIKDIARTHAAKAKQTRVVLSHMLGFAVRMDAITHNPVAETRLPAQQPSEPRALSKDEQEALRRGIYAWMHEKGVSGPRRAPDLLDIVDMMLGTGMRIGELCALRWSDVDLKSEHPSILISGTVVRITGQGLTRQAHTKNSKRYLRVYIGPSLVALLTDKMTDPDTMTSQWDTVFASSTGTLRDPYNIRRQFRDARAAAGFDWVTPHTFRKTATTKVERARGVEAASQQAGHSDTDTTSRYYVQPTHEAPVENAAVLDAGLSRSCLADQSGT